MACLTSTFVDPMAGIISAWICATVAVLLSTLCTSAASVPENQRSVMTSRSVSDGRSCSRAEMPFVGKSAVGNASPLLKDAAKCRIGLDHRCEEVTKYVARVDNSFLMFVFCSPPI